MKIMITLEDGAKVDVDKKAFGELKKAIKEENVKKIVLSSVKCLMSSEKMMNDLVKKTFDGIDKLEAEYGKKSRI